MALKLYSTMHAGPRKNGGFVCLHACMLDRSALFGQKPLSQWRGLFVLVPLHRIQLELSGKEEERMAREERGGMEKEQRGTWKGCL